MKGASPRANADTAGFVLAGGQSRRMGTDKAAVMLGAETLIERAVGKIQDAGLRASIAGGRRDRWTQVQVIEDEGGGPLSGICAALESCGCQRALFLPVDQPLMPVAALLSLLQHASFACSSAAFFSLNGLVETFPVLLSRDMLSGLRRQLALQNRSCLAAIRVVAATENWPILVLSAERLAQQGLCRDDNALPTHYWFLNVNTPADLEVAQHLLTTPIG